MKKKKLSLRIFVETAASRPGDAGFAARALLHRPPAVWSVRGVRAWRQPHTAELVDQLLAEFERSS